jgi:hypothetical protein
MLHGPAALQCKRKDLRFDAALTNQPHPDWRDDLELLTIEGCMLGETVFYHPATRTLIACDLVENFHQSSHWLTRNYLRLGGILGRVSWHPLLRMATANAPAPAPAPASTPCSPGRSNASCSHMAIS